jgi:thioredoxin-related protein
MHSTVSRPIFLLASIVCASFFACPQSAEAVDTKPDPKGPIVKAPLRPLVWDTSYQQACADARKSGKLILAYFCGSDWDEWTKKLDKQVFKTDMFNEWATKNVVLLKFDFLKFKGGVQQEAIERYKIKYNVTKVPTILFLDQDGLLIARCGYDTASLREDEDKGKPAAWIKYCDETIANRPPPQKLIEQKTMDEAITYSRKHYLPVVMLITSNESKMTQEKHAELLKNQPFVQFVNQNFAFCQIKFPDETDKSPDAAKFRAFAAANKILPGVQMQIIVYDFFVQPPRSNILDRITNFSLQDTDPLIKELDSNIANPDYSGAWLDDWRQASFISNRLKRPMFILFTQDTSEYCIKFDQEIFQTDEFKKYAKKNLVLMKVDFPKDPEHLKAQTDYIKEQNKSLADQYAIRGYPTVIILNFMGQRIGESKYMKGGPDFFLKQMDDVVKNDRFSRP